MTLPDRLRRFLRPAVYQGGRAPYFEGWYYKAQAPNGEIACFIPGVSLQADDCHCFIQTVCGGRSAYLRYPPEAFEASRDCLRIRIGDSVFAQDGLVVRSPEVEADLNFIEPVPLSRHSYTLGIMGPFTLFPALECRHGLIAVRSGVNGFVRTGGGTCTLDGGNGYIEKDWGSVFPRAYVWTHAFWGEGDSFFFSAADVPVLGRDVKGLIAVLYSHGQLTRWSTYTGARLSGACRTAAGGLRITAAAPGGSLCLRLTPGEAVKLAAPMRGGMAREIRESCAGALTLDITARGGRVYHGSSDKASIEICGDVGRLLSLPDGPGPV